jgi:putative transposase
MARPLRRNIEDGWYHVFHRATQRGRIVVDDRDRKHFLDLLKKVHEQYRVIIHAYCLMDTHYHAIVQTPDANLSAAMQWLGQSHAAWYNARHDRVGPFWQGRFGSVPVEEGSWAYDLSLYVHANPVCTNAFHLGKSEKKLEGQGLREPNREEVTRRLKKLRKYPWSSYRAYGGYAKEPEWLTTSEILGRAHRKVSERPATYREDVKQILSKGVDEAKKEQFSDRLAIGSEAFKKAVNRLAKGGTRETVGKRRLRRRVSFDEVREAVASVQGRNPDGILTGHGDWAKWLIAWLARRYCGLTLREIGEQLGGKDYAAVSMALKRFETLAKKQRAIKSTQRRVTQMLNVET